jgi:hypothetical protein
MAKQPLTEAQEKTLDEAEEYVRQAHEEARSRIAAAGISEVPDFACRRCDCDGFTPSTTGRCGTPRCNHFFLQHNIPF